MISKKFTIALIFSLPAFWLLFIILPQYTLPVDCVTDNFIYAETFIKQHFDIFHYNFEPYHSYDNFLYIILLATINKFFDYTTYNSSIVISLFSLLFSYIFLARTINSRHSNVNFFIVLLLFLSTAIWAGILGDEILFNGWLFIMVLNNFWQKRYTWLLFWIVINFMAQPITILYFSPLILVSYIDVFELKPRERKRFLITRLIKTILWFVLPLSVWLFYSLVLVKLPIRFNNNSEPSTEKLFLFDKSSFYMGIHYVRYFILPLVIGILFYLIKQRKKIGIKYYAILLSFIVLPFCYNAIFIQNDNLFFKNYYIIYLGCITINFLFIRDFRSLSQKIAIGIFILFFGWNTLYTYGVKALQSYHFNIYSLAMELKAVPKFSMYCHEKNYISWKSNCKTEYTEQFSVKEIAILQPTLIYSSIYSENIADYTKFILPIDNRKFSKEQIPENILDKFFYSYRNKLAPSNKTITLYLKNNNKHFELIKNTLLRFGAKEL